MHLNLDAVGLILAFVAPAFAEELVYTTGITGSAHAVITPPPNGPVPEVQVTAPITISVANSFGAGLFASFGINQGSTAAISYPGNGAIGSSFQAVYPPNWAGRIAIAKENDPNYINGGGLIEAS